ncbi:MAG TPA: hypothetical protein VFO10_09285 [Oligoflexus sp.]|uniref:hypothetical protein n=1 Tax=Oligoflexus sp. TaxID=1971216 RepID=UPI002D7F3D29|nr:hypothetical protein [Oligoflexus sp.]HET9237432.1 hypothetical protein [Oligoflexus sp.]
MKHILLTVLVGSLSAMAQAAAPSVHVEMTARPNGLSETWTLRGVNGRKLLCPDTQTHAQSCVVDQVVPPSDCDWECQDGVLSGQGRSVFRGRFASGSTGTVFIIEAAWDSWRNTDIRGPLYRIRRSEQGFVLEQVERQKKARAFTTLDFSKADAVNFQMEPSRADDMLNGSLGVLASGQLRGQRFIVDQIWRQWSPRLTCEAWTVAKARAFPEGTDAATMIFGTEAEAISYKDPEGRSVGWLIWEREDDGAIVFRSGLNDLWAEVFAVATRGCAVTVLAEH